MQMLERRACERFNPLPIGEAEGHRGRRVDHGPRGRVSIPFRSGKRKDRARSRCAPRGCTTFQSPSDRGSGRTTPPQAPACHRLARPICQTLQKPHCTHPPGAPHLPPTLPPPVAQRTKATVPAPPDRGVRNSAPSFQKAPAEAAASYTVPRPRPSVNPALPPFKKSHPHAPAPAPPPLSSPPRRGIARTIDRSSRRLSQGRCASSRSA